MTDQVTDQGPDQVPGGAEFASHVAGSEPEAAEPRAEGRLRLIEHRRSTSVPVEGALGASQ